MRGLLLYFVAAAAAAAESWSGRITYVEELIGPAAPPARATALDAAVAGLRQDLNGIRAALAIEEQPIRREILRQDGIALARALRSAALERGGTVELLTVEIRCAEAPVAGAALDRGRIRIDRDGHLLLADRASGLIRERSAWRGSAATRALLPAPSLLDAGRPGGERLGMPALRLELRLAGDEDRDRASVHYLPHLPNPWAHALRDGDGSMPQQLARVPGLPVDVQQADGDGRGVRLRALAIEPGPQQPDDLALPEALDEE
jgi:hypothetical protein